MKLESQILRDAALLYAELSDILLAAIIVVGAVVAFCVVDEVRLRRKRRQRS
ncbi:hypothetical protein JQ604_25920 [Bradyrhizobium jicamae]|uniref:hypothetical protein n=1 Tax=Bradyrhizobium jicamae TaxID=280332 RepID=UPI001BA92188|nr:hypothetical protein [Bradyrhizobium jicamae]MBR0755631.1 hypothetical protein [Bradyrhizobium jicamae]